MDLKFYLNKIVKVDNVEGYTLKALLELKARYEKFIDKTSGFDPDFPTLDFGMGTKGEKFKKKHRTVGEDDPQQSPTDSFDSLDVS